MYKFLTITAFFFIYFSASAQDSIVVKKDPRLDVLTAKQAAINKRTASMTSNGQYKGFRVQVLSTTDRAKALTTKAELLTRFPEEKSYTVFQSPNFRIRIGNFLKKEDAEAFRKVIAKLYPQGVYVVPDVIEYTPPADDEEIIE
jgi:hypothetical protein